MRAKYTVRLTDINGVNNLNMIFFVLNETIDRLDKINNVLVWIYVVMIMSNGWHLTSG